MLIPHPFLNSLQPVYVNKTKEADKTEANSLEDTADRHLLFNFIDKRQFLWQN